MAHSKIDTIVGQILYTLQQDTDLVWDEGALVLTVSEIVESPKPRILTCIQSLVAGGIIQGRMVRGKYEGIQYNPSMNGRLHFDIRGATEAPSKPERTWGDDDDNCGDMSELRDDNERLSDLVRNLQHQADIAFNDLLEKQSELNQLTDSLDAKDKEIEVLRKSQGGILEIHVHKPGRAKPRIITDELFHKEMPILLDLARARKNIFIYGPTGCGKSHVCKQVAGVLELDYRFISCTAGMSEGNVGGRSLPAQPDKAELMSTYKDLLKSKIDKQAAATLAAALTSGFSYVISEFVHCYEHGGIFLLDEMDAADSNVLLFINSALANGHAAVPSRPKNPYAVRHADFVCMAAANTPGTGGDREFTGRTKLDGATLDRFQVGKVRFDYDRELERKLCVDNEGTTDEDLLGLCWDIREAIAAHRLERAMSTRFIIDATEMKRDFNWSHKTLCQRYFTGWRADEIAKVRDHACISSLV